MVLVADDEPSMLALLSAYIRSKGYRVLEASDGDMAWQLAHQHLPNVVVLDVMMPGMSGWEVCKKIRESVSLAHTGVVMLTGIGESLNELTSPLYGADAYIDKPFEFAELEARIRETLERRRAGTLGRPDGGSDEDEDEEAAAGKSDEDDDDEDLDEDEDEESESDEDEDDRDDADDSDDDEDEESDSDEDEDEEREDEPVTQRFSKGAKGKKKAPKPAFDSAEEDEEPSEDEESAPPAKKAGKKVAAKPAKKAAAKPAKKAGKKVAAKPAKKVAAKPAKKAGKKKRGR